MVQNNYNKNLVLGLTVVFSHILKSGVAVVNIENNKANFTGEKNASRIYSVSLYKCPDFKAGKNSQDVIEIPSGLRQTLSVEREQQFLRNFGQNFYKFHLVGLNGSKIKQFECSSGLREIKLKGMKAPKKPHNFFTPFGFLLIDSKTRVFLNPEHFCVSKFESSWLSSSIKMVVRTCVGQSPEKLVKSGEIPPENKDGLLVPKCNPIGSAFRMTNWGNFEKTPIFEPDWTPNYEGNSEKYPNYLEMESALNCSATARIVSIPYYLNLNVSKFVHRSDFKFTSDGNLFCRSTGNSPWGQLTPGEFCVDGLVSEGGFGSQLNSRNFVVVQCLKHPTDGEKSGQLTQYVTVPYLIAASVACLFLLIIVVVYLALWDLQNAHGRTVCAFSLCMFFWYLSLLVGYAFSLREELRPAEQSNALCISIAVLSHFFNVAVFSWLTILNFDIFWTVLTMRSTAEDDSSGRKRFFVYSLFGFGIPLFIVSISLVLECQFGLFDDTVIRPEYGVTKCILDGPAFVYHVAIPAAILYLFNLIFGISTMKMLWDYHRDTTRLSPGNLQPGNYKRFGKLFLVLGITWIFEIVANVVVKDSKWTKLWTILDFWNFFQAAILFYIFVCRPDVRNKFLKKYPSSRRILQAKDNPEDCYDHFGYEETTLLTLTISSIPRSKVAQGNRKK